MINFNHALAIFEIFKNFLQSSYLLFYSCELHNAMYWLLKPVVSFTEAVSHQQRAITSDVLQLIAAFVTTAPVWKDEFLS
jgi:hypothetical protein